MVVLPELDGPISASSSPGIAAVVDNGIGSTMADATVADTV